MNKFIEKILYSLGINVSFYSVDKEMKLLQKTVPKEYMHRQISDIGCGDGRTSEKLKNILKPRSYTGYDLSKELVASAKRRGINASIADVENIGLSGDLAILWGSLHHLNEPEKALSGIYKRFNSIIIRESVDTHRLLEVGHRLSKEDLKKIISASGIKEKNCVFVDNPLNKSVLVYVN
jgi:SAM-dependent methyltransferase